MKSIRFFLSLAVLAFTFRLAVCAQAQTFTVLADFNGTNGSTPLGLVQATDGNFYGVTRFGGAYGKGNVFKVTPTGQLTSVYSFCSQPNCPDGFDPEPAPILGSDGKLYGTTAGGGPANGGTVYRITLDGTLTTLYSFCTTSACLDGGAPTGIIQATDGNFYGTTPVRGKFNYGTLFQITPTGTLHVLYSFCALKNCLDGSYPYGPPIQGINGSFYGTTIFGGSGSGGSSEGVVYELTPGKRYQVLENFCYGSLEACPFGFRAYGTAASTGNALVLHTFYFNGWIDPATSLILANDGNLYGVGVNNDWDNLNGYSSIFQITPAGEFTSLYSSYNSLNGPLFQGTDGNFYGTSQYTNGNNVGHGTVFKVANGLVPLVQTVPTMGKVGKSVLLLGNGLNGSTSVTFNGVAASFTVESDTYIKATVPKGATTGTVSVVTPSGTLNSNPQFVVTK